MQRPGRGHGDVCLRRVGQLTTAAGTTVTYNGYAPIAGSGTDPFSASYDADGGLVQLNRGTRAPTYTYDGEQQLVPPSPPFPAAKR